MQTLPRHPRILACLWVSFLKDHTRLLDIAVFLRDPEEPLTFCERLGPTFHPDQRPNSAEGKVRPWDPQVTPKVRVVENGVGVRGRKGQKVKRSPSSLEGQPLFFQAPLPPFTQYF